MIKFGYLNQRKREMHRRTFLRTMLDIFFNNPFVKAIESCVKFCNEQQYYHREKLKFSENLPIKRIESLSPQFGQIVTKTR